MTVDYKVGEHVKIIKTDDDYEDLLGDQTGLVGTVKIGGYHPWVIFPHTGDKDFYYLHSEVELAGKRAEPAYVPKFVAGDYAKIVGESYGESYRNRPFEVIKGDDTAGESVELQLIPLEGRPWKGHFPVTTLEKTEKPKPEPKFKKGDWVKVKGYSSSLWEGVVGQVTIVSQQSDGGFDVVIKTHNHKYSSGGFSEKYLVATEEPYVPKFKVDDYVKVSYPGDWQDKVGQVIEVPTAKGGYSRVRHPDNLGQIGLFHDRELTLTTKPEKFKVGDWVKVAGRNDKYDGIVGQIVDKAFGRFWTVKGTDGEDYQFAENKLVTTTEPWKPKFAVGDWVKVVNYNSDSLEGKVGQITGLPVAATGRLSYYTVTVGNKKGFIFTEDQLVATVEPHWTETKPVGAVAQVLYKYTDKTDVDNSKPDRVIIKVSETHWMHLYQSAGNGIVGAQLERSPQMTKALIDNRNRKLVWINH